MAMELQVYVAVINTEPPVPGQPGIIIRSQRTSTLLAKDETPESEIFALANNRLGGLIDDVVIDARGQLELAERETALP